MAPVQRKIAAADQLAAPFTTMAKRIMDNLPTDFGGAIVIVGPTGEVAIELLSLDPSGDEAAFWSVASAKVEAAKVEAMQAEQSKSPGFGGGFRPR